MKDQLELLLAGLLCSVGAWAFWHFLGADAANIIGTIVIISLTVDNRRLRVRLRKQIGPSPE
jgi:hypothetical protein